MKIKHIMLISLLLVILTIGSVSAADNVTSDNLAAGKDLNLEYSIDSNDTNENMGAENTDILSDTPRTLTELNSAIASAGAELTLTKDYLHSVGDPTDIIIDKKITIDGAGHTIDANNTQSVFLLQANEIVLKNVRILNGKNYMRGGVGVYASNSANSALINCTFTNCYGSGTNGGAVSWINSPNGIIANCTFIGCTANLNAGGSLGIESANTTISNCSFINSSADYEGGGAIYCRGENTTIEGSTFINSATYEGNGRSIKADANNVTIINCKFERNAQRFPYEILGGTIINCTFNGKLYDDSTQDSFKHLQQLITNSDSEVNLTRDYTYSILDTGAISIGKNITINGMGHTIDAKKLTQILQISSNGVALKNIRFINGYGDMTDGGAIICNGANLTVSNCTFINCTLSYYGYGGAISSQGDNTTIENSTFINSSAESARAICINGKNSVIKNSVFEDKNAQNFNSEVIGGLIINCTFNGNLIDENTQNSFRKLKRLINEATTELNLTEDYLNLNYDSAAISISKAITIDGMGHTIDCNHTDRAFYILSANVTIKNIKFKNGFTEMSGGAVIYIASGENCIITNCSFEDSNVYYDQGGAIYVASNNALVADCSFINCYSYDKGAAIYWSGNDGLVYNCSFVKCRPDYKGTVTWHGSNGAIANSNFINCSGGSYAGGVFWEGDNGTLIDTNFINSGSHTAGAVYWEGDNGLITNCLFTNSQSYTNGGAIHWANKTGRIENSTFNKFQSGEAHAIYVENDIVSISNSKFMDERYSTFNEIITGGNITNCTLNENDMKSVDLDVSIASNITGPCQIGDSIEFTVTVTNNGPSNATGTYVSLIYPDMAIQNSYDTLNGSVCAGNSSGEMFWTIGNLGAGETATLTITSKTLQTGNSSLSVTVVSSLNDVNTSNNAASSIISILAKASTLTIDTNINGSSVTLMFTIPEDAMGTISISVDGTNYNKTPVGGKSSLNLNLAAGTYPVSATYSGDVKYMPTTNNTLFIVNTIAGNTFTDLKSIIDAASPGDTIKLEDNYTNDGSITEDGIAISKAITIDGNGHTLNANGKSRTFVINTSGVTIKNTIFTNGHQDNTGSAIYWSGCTVNVLNCTFINNAANYDGGAIGWTSSPNSSVSNCTFINNTAQMGGGAIYSSWTNNWSISNCIFINSYARYDGGAIITWGDNNGLISNCTFEDNSAGRDGETVFWYNGNGNIDNSKFININKHGGKVIYSTNTNVIISNSNFEDETVENLNEIIYGGTVINCTLNSPSTKIDPSMTITTTDIHYGENATINISISNDATGSIIITVDNNDYELPIVDGKATLTINNLETGTYTAYATYTGDMKYLPANASSTFTVSSKANKTFTDLKNLIDAASPKDTIKLEDDYTNDGSITADGITISKAITIDGKGHTLDAKGSSRIFKINAENVTLKNIIFKNGHGNNGGAIQWMNTKGIAENCTFISCSAENGRSVYWNGENEMINKSRFDHSTATQNGGAIYWNANSGEIANSIFTNSRAQNGGAVYVPENRNVEIKSSIFDSNIAEEESGAVYGETVDADCTFKNNTYTPVNTKTFISINETAVYTGNDILITTLILNNDKGVLVNTGTVEIYINSELMATIPANTQYIHTTGEIGTYQVLAKFIDDSSYKGSSSTDEFTVIPVDISGEIETSNEGIFTLEFPDDAEGTLTVFIDGTKYKVYDIIGGILKIDLSDKKGKYNITFEYSGDDNYPAFKKDANITVETNPSITASNAKVLYSAETTYKITVYKNKGITANGVSVVIKQNNKKFKTIKTNSKGIASFKVTQTPGTYKLKITSLGKTVTKTLTIKHIITLKTATVKKSAKKQILQATLSKVNKKYLKKKTVTFKFNGKTYKAKTNSKGVAKVTLKKSALANLKGGSRAKIQAPCLKDTVKKSLKVQK